MMREADVRSPAKRLIDDAVTLGKAKECGKLIFCCVCLKLKEQADALKPYRRVF